MNDASPSPSPEQRVRRAETYLSPDRIQRRYTSVY
jgi:hypothetical protein